METSPQELFLWFLLGVCVLQVFFPGMFWYSSAGWKVRGKSEPSDSYLFMTRLGSCIGVIVVCYMLHKVRHPFG